MFRYSSISFSLISAFCTEKMVSAGIFSMIVCISELSMFCCKYNSKSADGIFESAWALVFTFKLFK